MSTVALLRLSLKYARSYWLYIVFVVVLQLAATIAALFLPSLNAQIIDQGVAKGDTDFIWSTGMTMIIVCLVQVVTAVTAIFFGARTGMGVGRDLRRAIYSKVDELSTLEVGKFGSATLITRNTNDVQQVQMLVLMTLNFMVSTPIMCIGGIIMALREDVGLSWLVWVSVPALFIVVGILVYLLMPLFRRMQEQVDDINGVLREQITGIRVVRAFVREPFEADRYADANRALTETSVKVGNLFVLMFPAIMMILHLATAAVLWFGGHRVDAGQMEVGSLTAFLQYLLQILVAVMMGVFMMMMIPRAVVCAERISEVLDSTSSMIIPKGVDELPRRGELEFRNVTFGYPGAEVPVLENLSFTAQPGTTTAIIGATGAGKSTIVNLIPRLLDPQTGDVLIDGVPVSAFNRHQLAQLVGLVPQKPYLFSGTIASNLRFGNEFADDSELWEALTTAQATDFVTDKTDQLEAVVAQGGTNFSGGQRQRLCIARALAAKPKIFVFDDSFSALDVATDGRLRSALEQTTADSTVVVVAQRVSTIRDADQIIVLDEGKIVGRGTHDELVDANETYQEIVESQLATEGVN
nr:ABC transporter ATP-binding protein [Brevibacterium sp. RIT 803]